jgi:hypothetical protein
METTTLEAFFGDTEPDHDTLTAWGTQLKATCTHLFVAAPQNDLAAVAAKHGMSVPLWERLSPTEKYTRERQWLAQHGQAPTQKQRRPTPLTLTSAQVAALAALPPTQRATAYRALQEGGQL